MLYPVRPVPLSVEQVAVQQPTLVFGRSKSSQTGSTSKGQKIFSYSSVIGTNETEGQRLVKRNLTRVRRWCRCCSDHDCLYLAMPKTLDIRKDGQQGQCANDDQHHYNSALQDP